MNELVIDGERLKLVSCHNHPSRLAQTTGPGGEPLCSACAVALAKRITRQSKLARRAARRGAMAPSIKTRRS